MKTLKTILSVFALAAVVSTATFAQETANVGVTANVIADLTISADEDVALGTIQSGASSTIAAGPWDATTESNLGTGAQFGIVRVAGASGASVDVSFTDGALQNASNNDLLNFVTTVHDSTSATTSAAVATGDNRTLGGGLMTLYIGGTLDAPSAAEAYTTATGTSVATIDVTVTYN